MGTSRWSKVIETSGAPVATMQEGDVKTTTTTDCDSGEEAGMRKSGDCRESERVRSD